MFILQVSVFQIQSDTASLYVSWSGDVTVAALGGQDEDTVELNGLMANKTGFRHGQQVRFFMSRYYHDFLFTLFVCQVFASFSSFSSAIRPDADKCINCQYNESVHRKEQLAARIVML